MANYEQFLEEQCLTQEDMKAALQLQPAPLTKEPEEPYYVGPSSIEGRGIFAARDVEGFVGKFKLDEEWYEAGRFVNHSSTPNAYVERTCGLILLFGSAQRGEEITVDYRQVKRAMEIGLKDKHLIVDNFCEDIEDVLTSVFAAGFGTWLPNKGKVGTSVYEGMGFWGHHAPMIASLIGAIEEVVVPNSMFFRNTNEGMEKAYIHSDRETGNHTCIAYLSDNAEESGTAFFKHLPTGLTEMPSFAEMESLGIAEELKHDMVSRDSSKWEQVGFVEAAYNRALIFEAPLFHSRFPLEGIGTNSENGRLIWASHFYKLHGDGSLH